MTIYLSVCVLQIHPCMCWKLKAYIYKIAKREDTVREVVQGMQPHKV